MSAPRGPEGISTLEMLFVLPVLLILLFGLIEFGMLFGQFLAVNNAAREGAREAVVFRAPCNAATVQSEVETTVQNYGSQFGLTIPASDISVSGQCGAIGSASTVSVALPYTFRFLPLYLPGVGPTLNLSGTSVMRNEG